MPDLLHRNLKLPTLLGFKQQWCHVFVPSCSRRIRVQLYRAVEVEHTHTVLLFFHLRAFLYAAIRISPLRSLHPVFYKSTLIQNRPPNRWLLSWVRHESSSSPSSAEYLCGNSFEWMGECLVLTLSPQHVATLHDTTTASGLCWTNPISSRYTVPVQYFASPRKSTTKLILPRIYAQRIP